MEKKYLLKCGGYFFWLRNMRFFLIICGIFLFSFFYCLSQEIKDSDACLKCHADYLKLDKKFIHPLIKDGKCKQCHISYDMDGHKEQNPPVLDVCLSCHTQEKLGRSHPAGDGIIDPNTNSLMTCVSSCHLIHGSDYKYMLPFKNNMELCLSCHKEF